MSLKNFARDLFKGITKEKEMAKIKSDKRLLSRLKAGHNAIKKMKGRFVE